MLNESVLTHCYKHADHRQCFGLVAFIKFLMQCSVLYNIKIRVTMVTQWLVKFDSTEKKVGMNQPLSQARIYHWFSVAQITTMFASTCTCRSNFRPNMCFAVDINFIAVASTIQFMPEWLTGWDFEILCNHYFVSSSVGQIYCAPVFMRTIHK